MQCEYTTIKDTIQQIKGFHEESYTKEKRETVATDTEQYVRIQKNREDLA
jgi:hypothetical protein